MRNKVIVLILLAVLLCGCSAKKDYQPSGSDTPTQEITPDPPETYSFFGVDSRSGDNKGRSDVIMLLNIDHEKKQIKVVSVYRDTLMDTGGITKCNAAYAYGGAFYAMDMLEKNLDLNIKGYAAADFKAAMDVIDILGGVDLEITDEEAMYANRYIREMNELYDLSEEEITGGTVHLDGAQAVGYSRVRYTEGWDYKRTERQRTILSLVAEKLRNADKEQRNKALERIIPDIYTDLSEKQLTELANSVISYEMAADEGFPVYKQGVSISGLGDCVAPTDLIKNVKWLHEYLYGEKDYVPSEDVQKISKEIDSLY